MMAAMRVLFVFAAFLAQPSSSANLRKPQGQLKVLVMHSYGKDCGLTQPISLAAARAKNPGAGMSPSSIEPFVKVLKDGFYEVACVADYMFTHGDKFGDHSDEYLVGDVSNVSIVHYAAHVAAEDKEEMTHEVCFSFCRTIPDMNFFGINNGNQCYCMTYYQPMADDNSMCDMPCDGNPGAMCGGKSKSSVFGMHACDNTASELGTTEGKMSELDSEMMSLEAMTSQAASDMQTMAADWQTLLGNAGDSGAADLMQAAKEFAGKLEQAASAAKKVDETVGSLKASAASLQDADLTSSAAMTDAEQVLQDMEEATTQGAAAMQELESLHAQASPNITGQLNASQQYYPIMYFVDKEYDSVPSTCTGTAAATPMVGSFESCAAACNADIHDCVGFSYFPGTGDLVDTGLCFTMSKVQAVLYWTGCDDEVSSGNVKCVVKFAKFEGDSLKPDPSGKCSVCLEEASAADRCFA